MTDQHNPFLDRWPTGSAIAAAIVRSERVDQLVTSLAGKLPRPVAVVALGAYARRELTPHAEVELLLVQAEGCVSTQTVTEVISYPLWEQAIHADVILRTVDQSEADVRRSWSAASHFMDSRLIAGDHKLFDALKARLQSWRHDRERLRHRLRADAQHRHATHLPVTSSTTPDLVAGRGGLSDLNALRWLTRHDASNRVSEALDAVLGALERAEATAGHAVHRLTPAILSHIDPEHHLLEELHAQARWVAFSLDSALAPSRDDRQLGPGLALRKGVLVAVRPPALERSPEFGLRVANMVGLAPPSNDLLEWASTPGAPVEWDDAAREQFWRLLRAADWRAWDFLDVTGLILRFLPELAAMWRKSGPGRGDEAGKVALDSHSFLALRSLHEWTESDDALERRVWRWLRHRDWVYLSVLLHELDSDAAVAAARRLGVPDAGVDMVEAVVASYQRVIDTAMRRDLHDEDLLLELATHIGSRQRLSTTFLVAIAHELAGGRGAWSPWKADLMRQLFAQLEIALREPGEVGARRSRSLEQHRERIVGELSKHNLYALAPLVQRLPRRYVLTHTPAFVARHLALLNGPKLRDGEVRSHAYRRKQPGLWDLLLVARDRPGLLATVSGVLTLRGASVLAADAATSADGLVLDVFTVSGADALQWPRIAQDLVVALRGEIPLQDLLGSRPMPLEDAAAIQVAIDSAASQFFNLVEVRAPDSVGLLYRIASALHAEKLDIHHARIATHPEGALDVFYVRDLAGAKLTESRAEDIATNLTSRLRALQ